MEEVVDIGPAREIIAASGLDDRNRSVQENEEMLISLLQDLQGRYGYLPREVLEWVSGRTGISLSRMFGVITFYTQFSLEKKGKHIVRCCEGTACHVKGGPLIVDAVRRDLGIDAGETTPDGLFSFETVNCLGACALAPLVVIDEEKAALNKRMETVAWGLFLVMLGCYILVPQSVISRGIWSVGIGLIMLGLNLARYLKGIKMSAFTTVLGVLAIINGMLELLGLNDFEGAIFLIILGLYLLVRPWFDKRGLFGKAEESKTTGE